MILIITENYYALMNFMHIFWRFSLLPGGRIASYFLKKMADSLGFSARIAAAPKIN